MSNKSRRAFAGRPSLALNHIQARFGGPFLFQRGLNLMNQIDPIEFGRVLARLDQQDQQSAEMREEMRRNQEDSRREIAQLRTDIQALLELANRGKGALFTLTSIGAAVGAILGALGHHFWGK